MKHRRNRLISFAAASLLITAGCSGDSVRDDTTTTPAPASTQPTTAAEPTEDDAMNDYQLPDNAVWAERPTSDGITQPHRSQMPSNFGDNSQLIVTSLSGDAATFILSVSDGPTVEFTKLPVGSIVNVDRLTVEVVSINGNSATMTVWGT